MALLKDLSKTEIWVAVEPFIKEMGADVLFWRERESRNTLKIELTLFSQTGVGMDLIERVHRLLLPRLEAIWGSGNVILDIASPGVGRTLKSLYELSFFVGKEMIFNLESQAQPLEGTIEEVKEKELIVKGKEETLSLSKEDLRGAKLKA